MLPDVPLIKRALPIPTGGENPVKRRRYEMGLRKVLIERTRARILDATRAILAAPGDLDSFTMAAVAKRAGVSRMTLFNQFKSEEGLVEALSDRLAMAGGLSNPRSSFVVDDPAVALANFIRVFARFWDHDRRVMRRLRAMGVLTPSVGRKSRNRDSWRTNHIEVLLERFHLPRANPVRGHRQETVDLLTALTSFEMFDALCTSQRPPDEVAELLTRVALNHLGIGGSRVRRGPPSRLSQAR